MRCNLTTGVILALFHRAARAGIVVAYGPLGELGDTTTCSNENMSDKTLADLFAIEDKNDATRDGNNFYYKFDLPCEKDYASAVALQCIGLDGVSRCHSPLEARSRHVERALQQESSIQKRAAYYCKDASMRCDDTVDANAFGNCPSGYERSEVEAKGYVSGFVCTRECSAEMKAQCLQSVCRYRRDQCAYDPSNRSVCIDSLIKCRENPSFHASGIATAEDVCSNYNVEIRVDGGNYPQCTGCVSYRNGICHLDNANFEEYLRARQGVADDLAASIFE